LFATDRNTHNNSLMQVEVNTIHISRLFFFSLRYISISFRHFRKISKRLSASSCLSVCLSVCPPIWNNSDLTGKIFVKFYIWLFFNNLSRKFKFHWNLTRLAGALHEDIRTFMITSLSGLLILRNDSDKICGKNQHIHFIFNKFSKIVPFMR